MQEGVTSRQLEIAAMLSRNGLYIIANPMFPTWTGVAVVCDANEKEGKPGRLFQLVAGEELSTNPDAWEAKGSYVAGGPYSIQSCEEQERIDEVVELNQELIADELKFWRTFATKAAPFLTSYFDILSRLKMKEANDVKELLDSVKPIDTPTTT